MRPVAVVAAAAVSPLGTGERAFAVGAPGDKPESLVGADPELRRAGLRRPLVARVPDALLREPAEPDRAGAMLEHVARALLDELERIFPEHRSLKRSLVVGTSAGGMASVERAARRLHERRPLGRELARRAFYEAPLAVLDRIFPGPRVQVLGACASSTLALGLGCRFLEGGDAELVIAGGYDALSELVALGFDALGATTERGLQPFRASRDGMAIGEGAALVALVRAGEGPATWGYLRGFGSTGDAVHVTAPDPEGRGLARAAEAALADADLPAPSVALVSAHATATPHNDAAETRALKCLLGDTGVTVHPFKGVIGHTLGAAGALEALAALSAMKAGVAPAAVGEGELEAGFPGELLARNRAASLGVALKLSAGFGGVNAALVLGREAGAASERPRRGVRLASAGTTRNEPNLELVRARANVDDARLERISASGALAASAVADALAGVELGNPERVALILATSVACLEENLSLWLKRLRGGARALEPRSFVRTSPNLPASECAIVFGLRGPTFAVGGGPSAALEALLVAGELVAAGDAEQALVVSCELLGEHARTLCHAAELDPPVASARAVLLTASPGTFRRDALWKALEKSALEQPSFDELVALIA